MENTKITWASEKDVPEILQFIKELSVYEKLEKDVVADEASLKLHLFGKEKRAEVIFLEEKTNNSYQKVAFALFFHNFSTFVGKPGLYLEDLFVKPVARGKGYGKQLLSYLAKVAVDRNCGRFEWTVLDWNTPAIEFYISLGSTPMTEWTTHRVSGEALIQLAQKSQSTND